ncbi:MAG: protease, partial [Calditrichaeota bacterium]
MPHFRVCLSFVILMTLTAAHSQETRLLRSPAISDRHIAFVYANDIWIAGIDGNDARRLTTFTGAETEPKFSPDGRWIAFSGQYDGNTDVYIVSVNGGEPQRLTWHPGDDAVRTWTNDGQAVVFASGRTTGQLGYPQLFQVSVKGGLPPQLPIPRVNTGKFSPDGRSFVYQEIASWESEWRNYRGGQNNPIRIITLQTLQVQKL